MERNTSKPNTQIAFRAREEDREYLRILAAKAHCSQGALLLKLLYDYGEAAVKEMREPEVKTFQTVNRAGFPLGEVVVTEELLHDLGFREIGNNE